MQLSRSKPELHQTVVRLDVLQTVKPQLRQSTPSSDINILLIHSQFLLLSGEHAYLKRLNMLYLPVFVKMLFC